MDRDNEACGLNEGRRRRVNMDKERFQDAYDENVNDLDRENNHDEQCQACLRKSLASLPAFPVLLWFVCLVGELKAPFGV